MPKISETSSPQRVGRPAEPAEGRGRYVTDGRRLFRVVSALDPLLGEAAELENCRTLEVRSYTPDELIDMRLRRVFSPGRPAG